MHTPTPGPFPDDQDDVRAFVETVLRTGFMLTDLLANILDLLPEDAFPGESPGEVLVEMLTGSLRPVTDAAGPYVLSEATALLGAMSDRTLLDLRAAAELARRQ
ncbi:MAG: hypothetical protein JHC95_10365 [Solirubrobacteraceae bacterium]|nr:hypothetical protein [Solirubrobacteraceae bacterium]